MSDMLQACYEETATVEFRLTAASPLRADCKGTKTWILGTLDCWRSMRLVPIDSLRVISY